ncbi:MAG: serine hydrolase domain-containing protein [Deltaproteobacteria bacterium]|nr:serine hydrolase domain-containing protein [Deltaproteobacteria bacterium]
MSGTSPALREAIVRELERGKVPGCALAWTRRDGTTGALEHGLANVATGQKVDGATRFHLFSGTKLYTAAAVMLLVERGAVTLDAPVKKYLPELLVRDELTVRHLLSHASGLKESLRAFLSVHLAGEAAPSTSAALARYSLGRGDAPGRAARYGNVNYAILGELVSRLAGLPYEAFVRRELLDPLGADLSFEDPGAAQNAVGYVSRFSPMLLALRFLLPDVAGRIRAGRIGGLVALAPYSLDTAAIGGLVGTASGFLPFVREMLSPEDGVLRADSKREMLTLHSRGAAGVVSRDGVGLGWKRGTADGATFWNHEGGGAGFCSETRLYPDAGLGMVILINLSQSASVSRLCHRIAEHLRR